MLKLWAEFGDPVAMLNLVGEDLEYGLDEFRAKGMSELNIRITEGSTLGKSKTLRDNDLKELWQLGIIKSDTEIKKMMEFNDPAMAKGRIDEDRNAQRRELAKIIQGAKVEIRQWDNHFTHREEVESVLKSPGFDEYSNEIQEELIKHWSAHNEAIAQVEQMQAQAAMQRGVAASGAPRAETNVNAVTNGPQNEMPEMSTMSGMGANAETGMGVMLPPQKGESNE